jgi:hypothetical protein
MIAGTQQTALRKTTMRPDTDGREVDDAHLFTHPGVVSHLEFPRNMDVHSRFPIYSLSNLSPKEAQKPGLEPRRPWERRKKKEALQKIPNDEDGTRSTQIESLPIIEEIISDPAALFLPGIHKHFFISSFQL